MSVTIVSGESIDAVKVLDFERKKNATKLDRGVPKKETDLRPPHKAASIAKTQKRVERLAESPVQSGEARPPGEPADRPVPRGAAAAGLPQGARLQREPLRVAAPPGAGARRGDAGER